MDNANQQQINKQTNYFILIFCMLTLGCLSVYLGKDLDWDLANYHYYNPFAFLNNRYDQDFWPASLNTYLNPTLDFLTYFLINTFPPRLVGFTLGAIHGMAVWLVFNIALLYLPKNINSFYIALIVTAVGAYCPQFIHGFGLFFGDITVGIFVLTSFYLIAKMLLTHQKSSLWLFSGLLLGLGLGLKLTTAFYYASTLFSLLFLYLFQQEVIRLKSILFWVIGSAVGFIITAGYWLLFLWEKFQNPLFPFFNKIFHSPYYPEINWEFTEYFPQNVWEWIFYPFFFSLNGSRVDMFFIDLRLPILYVLFILVGLIYLFNLYKNKQNIFESIAEKWLILFFLFSYFFWELSFSILRYAVILEMLVPLLIVLLIRKIFQNPRVQNLTITTIFGTIICFVFTDVADRGTWTDDSYFGFKIPPSVHQIKNGLVLLPTKNYEFVDVWPLSLSYIIPFFPPDWRFIGVPYPNITIENTSTEISKRISQHKGPLYYLTSNFEMPTFITTLTTFKLYPKKNDCVEIKIAHGAKRQHQVFLCSLVVR